MGKSFVLSPAQARQQKRDLAVKDRIVFEAQKQIKDVLTDAVEQVYAAYQKSGKYVAPSLDRIFEIGQAFYKKILIAAYKSCEAQTLKPTKRLSAVPQGDLPDGQEALDRVLKNRKYFERVMKRSRALFGRAQKQYLRRLEVQFRRILPLLENTDLSPKQAKKAIAEAWGATPARTTVIFQTESTRYFAKSQIAYFEGSSEIIGFLYDSIRDTSRTNWCSSRHGLIYRPGSELLRKNTPPTHYGCRSHILPLVDDAENRAMLADPRRDPEKVRVVPLPPGWNS